MSKREYSIGVVIPTWRAAKHLSQCLGPLIANPLKPKILVVDSSSDDETVQIAKGLGVDVVVISKAEFNHGLTREKARKLLNTDIVIMITQDAYALDGMIEKLIEPIVNGVSSIAYGRQIPHVGADLLESFPRTFNYPSKSHVREKNDFERFGVYTFFCSNSCAAYLNRVLDEVGGFPEVVLGEDTLVTAWMLERGHKIAYVAEAVVRHSHNYTLTEEFWRYYATGKMRSQHRKVFEQAGKDSDRGKEFVKSLMKELFQKKPLWVPYAMLQTAVRYFAYRLGRVL